MKLKRLLAWAGIGGVAIGSAIYAIKGPKKQIPQGPPEPIPEGSTAVIITAVEELEILKERFHSWFEYTLTPTKFRLYSIYRSRGDKVEGIPIYHVAPSWYLKRVKDGEEVVNKFEQGGFYATLWVKGQRRGSDRLHSHIQKGSHIEFHICAVGGSNIGIDSGEKIISPTAVVSYRFVS